MLFLTEFSEMKNSELQSPRIMKHFVAVRPMRQRNFPDKVTRTSAIHFPFQNANDPPK